MLEQEGADRLSNPELIAILLRTGLRGSSAVAISEVASDERIDLLVMGTACRTGIRGFFVGNTAEGVLERVDCSLLTVKPNGVG